jgi:nitrite reductase/ring-hydroxylating ferredoxin subunit/putative sterol carrier protein
MVARVDERKRTRFPFPGHPKGWYVVALSEEIPAGEIVHLHYFSRDLVAYRGSSGRAYVTDAYCPHLGAHLGHGGQIHGETIRCPYHGWRFEGDGRCVEVPYSAKIPPTARLDAFPVREQNGVVHVFYDPSGGAPWELPELDERGLTPARAVTWRGLATHVQEVYENTVDTAHIGPIHDGRDARIVGKPEIAGEVLRIDIEFQAPGDIVGMPDQLNDVHLHVTMRGFGSVVVETHVRNVDVRARQRIYATPVDEDTIDIRGIVHVRATSDEQYTRELAELFFTAYRDDFAKDFPIWENKRYLTRPTLAKGDGPIALYRRWCTQFYPAADSSVPRAAAESFDVAASSLRAGRMRRVLGPVQEQLASAAQTFLDRARRTIGRREAAARPSSDAPLPAVAADAGGSSAAFRVASAEEYFATLEKRFVPAAAASIDAVFQWELGGAGGSVFHAVVQNGHIRVARGAHERPTVSLVMAADDYVNVVNGDLDGVRAFTTGGGKVKGSIAAAMKMRAIFPAHAAR